jgi:hypothetical protein
MKDMNRRVWLARLAVSAMMLRLTLACSVGSTLLALLGVYEPDCSFARLKEHGPWLLGLLLVAAVWALWKRHRYQAAEGRTAFVGALFLESMVVLAGLAGWVHEHFGAPGIAAWITAAFLFGLSLDLAWRRTYRAMLGLDDVILG